MNPAAVINPKVEAEVRKQRARATVTSLIIGILILVLVGMILALFLIPVPFLKQELIVSYTAVAQEETELEAKEFNPTLQRKPAAPSSAMAKVIASNLSSPTALPVAEVPTAAVSMEFGDGDDFGVGFGTGSEGVGGGASFFGQKAAANRVAFVIDYSASMYADDRHVLMREELSRALKDLKTGTKYQMIFFAGPVWIGGDQVKFITEKKAREAGNVIIAQDGQTYEWSNDGGTSGFRPKGKRQKATWLTVASAEGKIGMERRKAEQEAKETLARSLKAIQETPLVWGTRWKYALEMALDMEPAPQVIFFMTDGSTGKEAMDVARSVGHRAKLNGTVINCVAMMEPKAHEAMMDLARRTEGKFTVVEEGGKRREIPLE